MSPVSMRGESRQSVAAGEQRRLAGGKGFSCHRVFGGLRIPETPKT
jgi:hypothetical protein